MSEKFDPHELPKPSRQVLDTALFRVMHTIGRYTGYLSFETLGYGWIDFREACIALEWCLLGSGHRAYHDWTFKVMQEWIDNEKLDVRRAISGEVVSIKLKEVTREEWDRILCEEGSKEPDFE